MSGFEMTCPLPIDVTSTVQMAHGGGGRASQRLFEQVFLPAFDHPALAARHDSAVVEVGGVRVAFTTDTYVVKPLFFPGGDIGKLAIYGTVNDLAMAGATPLYLSVGFVIEEGLPLEMLTRVTRSMREAAAEAGVAVVTGDTKVVDRGKGDGIFINTAGVGLVSGVVDVRPSRVHPGDVVLVSGDVGRHGIAIMSVREGLEFESELESDCAPLNGIAAAILREGGHGVHCMRDLTRGGLSSALNEIATACGGDIHVEESAISVCDAVAGACGLLGLDPLYVANEGRMAVFVAPERADAVLAAMRAQPAGGGATIIGRVEPADAGGRVLLRTALGSTRILDMLNGEQLPRIC